MRYHGNIPICYSKHSILDAKSKKNILTQSLSSQWGHKVSVTGVTQTDNAFSKIWFNAEFYLFPTGDLIPVYVAVYLLWGTNQETFHFWSCSS